MAVFFDQNLEGCEIAFNDGTNNETFSYDTEVNDTGTDLYTFAEAFKTWANHGDRGWSGSRVFDYAFSTFGTNHGLTLTVNGTGAWTPNTAAVTALKLPAGTTVAGAGGGSLAGTAGIVETLSAKYAFTQWRTLKGSEGYISASGSYNFDPLHCRLKSAKVNAVLTHPEAYSLALALKATPTPRRAVFYSYVTSSYQRAFVPSLSFRPGRRLLHNIEFEVIEVA